LKKAVEFYKRVPIPTTYPASIANYNDGIWIADIETAKLILIEPESGLIKKQLNANVRRPQTISWDGEFLWIYDELTQMLFKKRLSDNTDYYYGAVPSVNLPYLGISCYGKTLYLISPDQPVFTVFNNKISIIKFPRQIKAETYDAPTHSCRGLYYFNDYLWTLDVENAEIFCIHPDTGTILTSYILPLCKNPSSLIIQKDRIYTIDLKSNELVIFKFNMDVLYEKTLPRKSHVEIVYNIMNPGPGKLIEMEFNQSLPRDFKNQKMLSDIEIFPAPDKKMRSQWDETTEGQVIFHNIRNLVPGDSRDITVKFDIQTWDLKYYIYPHKCKTLLEIPDSIKNKYLFNRLLHSQNKTVKKIAQTAQNLFETQEREIQQKVEEVVGDETNPFWIARKLYDFVVDKVKYILPYSSISSRKILKQGKGSCGNHATVYIALCQVAGLPARSIIGFSIWKDDSRLSYLDHEIPEVYLPTYGWVPVDTSRFMSLPLYGPEPVMKFRSFGTLSNRFFVNGFGRDITSEFAIKKYTEEILPLCDNYTKPQINFFMRWRRNRDISPKRRLNKSI